MEQVTLNNSSGTAPLKSTLKCSRGGHPYSCFTPPVLQFLQASGLWKSCFSKWTFSVSSCGSSGTMWVATSEFRQQGSWWLLRFTQGPIARTVLSAQTPQEGKMTLNSGTLCKSGIKSWYKERINMSRVRQRFWAKVGVSKVAFSPLITKTNQ
jgi:hypothetical protein